MDIKYDHFKSVDSSIYAIESLQKERALKIVNNNYIINGAHSIVKKTKDGFNCKIFLDEISDSSYYSNFEKFGVRDLLEFNNSSSTFIIEEDSCEHFNITVSTPQLISIDVSRFQYGSKNDFENKTHRLIIPIIKDCSFKGIEAKSTKIEDTITFFNLIEILIEGREYHVFSYSEKRTGKKYLILDGNQQAQFKDFKNDTNAILLSLGFVSGKYFQEEYYYQVFHEERKDEVTYSSFEKREPSVITSKELFDPSDFRQYLENIKHPIDRNQPFWMTKDIFSTLVTNVKNNRPFSRCCELIIEANSSDHVLLEASIFSIALETMTNIIAEEKESILKPIKNKEIAKEIIQKFQDILNEYNDQIDENGKKILKAKTMDFNKPTNSEKLKKPFELYGIKLSADDLQILNHRNKFLHGKSPFNEDELHDKKNELKYISSRLHFLVSALMLKYTGYKGHVIFYPAWIQYNLKQKLTDHLYKVI